jgi:hypothetical protein
MICKNVVDMLVGHVPNNNMLDEHLQSCKSCMQVKRVVQDLEAEGARLRRQDLDSARIQATRHAVVAALNEERVTTALPWILRPAGISLATAAVAILGVTLFMRMYVAPVDPAFVVSEQGNTTRARPVETHVAANIDTSFVDVQANLRTTLNGFRKRHGLVVQATSTDPDFQNLRDRLATANEGFSRELRTLNMLNGSGGYNE